MNLQGLSTALGLLVPEAWIGLLFDQTSSNIQKFSSRPKKTF